MARLTFRRLKSSLVVALSLLGFISVPNYAQAVGLGGLRQDVTRIGYTIDGWRVSAIKKGEQFRVVPNLAGDVDSHEGFISMMGIGEITGHGSSHVLAATVEAGYMVGCGVDVSDGASIGRTDSVSITPSVGVHLTRVRLTRQQSMVLLPPRALLPLPVPLRLPAVLRQVFQ